MTCNTAVLYRLQLGDRLLVGQEDQAISGWDVPVGQESFLLEIHHLRSREIEFPVIKLGVDDLAHHDLRLNANRWVLAYLACSHCSWDRWLLQPAPMFEPRHHPNGENGPLSSLILLNPARSTAPQQWLASYVSQGEVARLLDAATDRFAGL